MSGPRRHADRLGVLLIVTIFAITGTMSACGVYGKPVRVAPAADATQTNAVPEEGDEAVGVTRSAEESDEEPSDGSSEEK